MALWMLLTGLHAPSIKVCACLRPFCSNQVSVMCDPSHGHNPTAGHILSSNFPGHNPSPGHCYNCNWSSPYLVTPGHCWSHLATTLIRCSFVTWVFLCHLGKSREWEDPDLFPEDKDQLGDLHLKKVITSL